tara:strand:+ start:1418 stop:2392 length:975 start_codon:yes stop_codon:yes gene_type:complete
MSYIGKEPQTGAYSMLDALTASATASYSLTLDSVAFVPESANHLLVSLNGSIQKAGSSYTVSGSTLTFSSTLASSDSIDFVLALGNVLDIGTPSDSTVTNAKTNFVSTSSAAGLQIKGDGTTDGTLQLNCSQNSHGIKLKSPAHSASQSYTLTFPTTAPSADKFLKTDGSGNLSFADAGGITHYWSASRSSGQSVAQNTATTILFNVVTTATGITSTLTSDGRITIPSGGAGWYVVTAISRYADDPTSGKEKVQIQWYDTSAGTTENIGYGEMNTSGTYDTKVATGLKYLDVGDYVYVSVNQNNVSSASFIGGNGTAFYGFRIA